MNNPIYVTARFRSKKDKTSEMKELLIKLTNDTLVNEKGCIAYSYLQDTEDDTLFTSNEVWQNAEAEGLHWGMPHLQEALGQLPDLLNGEVKVKKWNRI